MNTRIRSSVRNMVPYVPGEQPNLPNIIKLNTNENPYPPSPAVARVLASVNADDLRLYPDPLCVQLRQSLASLYRCKPSQILVANGSDEALRLCADAFVENDGTIGYFDPSYSLYPVLAATRGFATKPVSLWPNLAWKMDADYTASLFFLANPNAPTGMPFDKAKVKAFCEKFNGIVVIDAAYADFADEMCDDLAFSLPNVLVCRTLSKSYSLAGLRLGFLMGAESLIEALYKIKDSYPIDRLAQAVAIAAVEDQAWMRGNVAKIKATRIRLTRELRAMGWTVCDSAANFLWTKPGSAEHQLGDAAHIFKTLRAHSIVTRFWNAPNLSDYLRITIGTDEQIDALLAALKNIV